MTSYGNHKCTSSWKIRERIPPGFARLYLVHEGEVRYKDKNCELLLKQNHLYIFPTVISYNMDQNIKNPLICTFLHIDFFPLQISHLIEISMARDIMLNHIFAALSHSIDNGTEKIIRAFADLIILYCKEEKIVSAVDIDMIPIINYIEQNIKKNIPIDELSSYSGYNSQYFIRLFKEKIGMTPHRYIIHSRLKEAKKLLREKRTISQIAEETGYSDVKSFSRSFKKNIGMSPSDFRESQNTQP